MIVLMVLAGWFILLLVVYLQMRPYLQSIIDHAEEDYKWMDREAAYDKSEDQKQFAGRGRKFSGGAAATAKGKKIKAATHHK